MPRKTTNKPKRARANTNPAVTALRYTAGISMAQEQLTVVDLVYDAPATSNASSTLNDVMGDYPVVSPDWSGLASTFAEYRVLAMEVRFIPNVTGATYSTNLYAPLYVVLDLTSSTTPLTSYTVASNYAVSRVGSLNTPIRLSHKMAGVEESTFISTQLTTVDYNFKWFATGVSASTNYGRYFVHWKVQFRGRN